MYRETSVGYDEESGYVDAHFQFRSERDRSRENRNGIENKRPKRRIKDFTKTEEAARIKALRQRADANLSRVSPNNELQHSLGISDGS